MEKILHTLLSELQKISRAETVVGQAIQSGSSTIVPISRVQIGFGAGGTGTGEGGGMDLSGSRRSGSAIGGGIRVEPVACVVVDSEGRAQLLALSGNTSTISKAIDLVPEVLERLGLSKDDGPAKSEKKPEKK